MCPSPVVDPGGARYRNRDLKTISLSTLLVGIALLATEVSITGTAPAADWWTGKYATGNWLGARDTLEEQGVQIGGFWKGYLYVFTGGGNTGGRARSTFDEELKFLVSLDFERMLGIPGLTADADVRWRDGENANKFAGASLGFNPSPIQTGKNWRMGQAYLTWRSGDLLPVRDMVTLSGGWQDPYNFFGVQPFSKFFTNTVIVANKGVGLSGIPWSSSYEAWGGFLKVKTTDWSYTQAGLYMAIPGATATANHGLYFQGASPVGSNGIFFLSEAGVTPAIGSSKLEGKYAVGFLYFGIENSSFYGSTYDQRWDLYFQADQRLFREPATDNSTPNPQGLTWINWFNYSPKYNSNVPFYFHTGLVYEGLIPGREKDQVGAAFALGNYSYNRIVARREDGLFVQDTYEAVVEVDYKIALNRFIYTKPFWQYIIRPDADGLVPNANVFGIEFNVKF
jgi:carbohydrate-selective porin OprB